MDTVSETILLKRPMFWAVGIVVGISLVIVISVQFFLWASDVSKAEGQTQNIIRNNFPTLAWAFDELERCQGGVGDYAKFSYLTNEQCYMALRELAKRNGDEIDVNEAIRFQEKLNAIAVSRIHVQWPLSMFVRRES